MIQETSVDSDPSGPANTPFECESRVGGELRIVHQTGFVNICGI